MRWKGIATFVAACTLVVACDDDDNIIATYTASLNGASEIPPVATAGTGAFSADLDDNSVFTYNLSFSGLGSNSTVAHLHGPATTAQNAAILVDLNAPAAGRNITLGATSGTGSGTIVLTAATVITPTVNGDSLRRLLDLGLIYVNVHSVAFPNGEIRGQVTRQ